MRTKIKTSLQDQNIALRQLLNDSWTAEWEQYVQILLSQ
jgi:hypothetical protein